MHLNGFHLYLAKFVSTTGKSRLLIQKVYTNLRTGNQPCPSTSSQYTINKPDDLFCNKLGNLALGNDCIIHVESTILPLNGAIKIKHVTQPIVRRATANKQEHRFDFTKYLLQ
jgi:hypothetical protein